MDFINELRPVARKEHTCEFCGGVIRVGERYLKETFVDGVIYNWISHIHCSAVCKELDMNRKLDYNGISSEDFECCVIDYVEERHFNRTAHEIDKEWQLPIPELVKKIYEEIKEETK